MQFPGKMTEIKSRLQKRIFSSDFIVAVVILLLLNIFAFSGKFVKDKFEEIQSEKSQLVTTTSSGGGSTLPYPVPTGEQCKTNVIVVPSDPCELQEGYLEPRYVYKKATIQCNGNTSQKVVNAVDLYEEGGGYPYACLSYKETGQALTLKGEGEWQYAAESIVCKDQQIGDTSCKVPLELQHIKFNGLDGRGEPVAYNAVRNIDPKSCSASDTGTCPAGYTCEDDIQGRGFWIKRTSSFSRNLNYIQGSWGCSCSTESGSGCKSSADMWRDGGGYPELKPNYEMLCRWGFDKCDDPQRFQPDEPRQLCRDIVEEGPPGEREVFLYGNGAQCFTFCQRDHPDNYICQRANKASCVKDLCETRWITMDFGDQGTFKDHSGVTSPSCPAQDSPPENCGEGYQCDGANPGGLLIKKNFDGPDRFTSIRQFRGCKCNVEGPNENLCRYTINMRIEPDRELRNQEEMFCYYDTDLCQITSQTPPSPTPTFALHP